MSDPTREDPKVEYLGELARLDLREGDTAVLMVQSRLSPAAYSRLREQWEQLFPGVRVLVLEDGARLGVIRREEETRG